MLLSLSLLGIILSVILLYFNARKYPTAIYLGAFFFLISYYALIQYIVLYSMDVDLVAVFYLNAGFVTYLIGPLLFFYIRSVLWDNAGLRLRDGLHLLPMLLYLAGTLPYIFTAWTYKLEVAAKVIESFYYIDQYNMVPVYQLIPKSWVFVSRPVLVLIYVFWSAGMLIQFLRSRKGLQVFSGQRFMNKWLWILLGFAFILVLTHTLVMLQSISIKNLNLFYTLNSFQVISALGLAGLLISPFFFPGILYGLPQIPVSLMQQEILNSKEAELITEPKTQPARFETEYLNYIESETDKCMEEFHPYLQQDFNLVQLSVLINIPVHHLAYYFKENKQMSFTDFRNRWRVEHAKNLILEGKSDDLTLEAIGILSGFTTRNTFLTAFKKVEGITPKAFVNKSRD